MNGIATADKDRPSAEALLRAVAELIEALSSEQEGDYEAAAECIRRAGAALQLNSITAISTAHGASSSGEVTLHSRGGLAPWQIRLVTTHIDANLEVTITTEALATVARLSLSHFMRAFRVSFGASPHRYIVRRRLERAQGLMLTTNAPLGQIALDCGLADQSHFARLFHKSVGETPGAWRRARAGHARAVSNP
jgi:AraC family transcriptional regulator